jgi:hypothetical protein
MTLVARPRIVRKGGTRHDGQFLQRRRRGGVQRPLAGFVGPRCGQLPGFLLVGGSRRSLDRPDDTRRFFFLSPFEASVRRFCSIPGRRSCGGADGIFAVIEPETEDDLAAHVVGGLVAPDQRPGRTLLAPAEVALDRVLCSTKFPTERLVTRPTDWLVAVSKRGQDGEERLDAGRDRRIGEDRLG